MNTTLPSRIELFFWNFAIQTLSNSRLMRTLLRSVLPRFQKMMAISPLASVGLLVSASGLIGLLTGLVLYYVSAILR